MNSNPEMVLFSSMSLTFVFLGFIASITDVVTAQQSFVILVTAPDAPYQFFVTRGNSVQFEVRAKHDVRLALSTNSSVSEPLLEFYIGDFANTKTTIKRDHQSPNGTETLTYGVLHDLEWRAFKITWDLGHVTLARQEEEPFLVWDDPAPVFFTHLGVSSGRGSPAHWNLRDVDCAMKDGSLGSCKPVTECQQVSDNKVPTDKFAICNSNNLDFQICCGNVSLDIVPPSTTPKMNISEPETKPVSKPESTPAGKAAEQCSSWADRLRPAVDFAGIDCPLNTTELRSNMSSVTKYNEIPSSAQLMFRYSKVGTGVLVSDRWILTAAHPLYLNNVTSARLGSPDMYSRPAAVRIFNITRQVTHPNFTTDSIYNDIALLQLHRATSFTEEVGPACLPTGQPFENRQLVFTGWNLDVPIMYRNKLRKIAAEKVSDEECFSTYPSDRLHPDAMMCTQRPEGRYRNPLNDHGAPLLLPLPDSGCLVSVIAICATFTPGAHVHYTRLEPLVPWIESIVWPD